MIATLIVLGVLWWSAVLILVVRELYEAWRMCPYCKMARRGKSEYSRKLTATCGASDCIQAHCRSPRRD